MRGLAFHFPYIAGGVYAPGLQVNSPGEPAAIWAGFEGLKDVPLSWPYRVPSLNLLANYPGYHPVGYADRPAAVEPNNYATGLNNFMFIGGFTGKKQA